MINDTQAGINRYLSWTMAVCGHTHKSGGLSPNQKNAHALVINKIIKETELI